MVVMEVGWATSSHRERVVASTRTNSTPPLFGPSRAKFNENQKNGSVSFFVSLISIDLKKKKNSVIRFPSKLVTDGRTHGRTHGQQ